jgi:hypothetical protein
MQVKWVFPLLCVAIIACSGNRAVIMKDVQALAKEDFLAMELGTPQPYDNPQVLRILHHGSAAGDSLKLALSNDNSVLVGYAAYALRRIPDIDATAEAKSAMSRIDKKTEKTYRDYFALSQLRSYLERQVHP